jgi:hypothetical protein
MNRSSFNTMRMWMEHEIPLQLLAIKILLQHKNEFPVIKGKS